jgi:hypothetical protein
MKKILIAVALLALFGCAQAPVKACAPCPDCMGAWGAYEACEESADRLEESLGNHGGVRWVKREALLILSEKR